MRQKNKLKQVIYEANKIAGQKQRTVQELFSHFMEKRQLQYIQTQPNLSPPLLFWREQAVYTTA